MGQLQWQAGGRSWRLGDYDKRRRTDENERENIPGEREQSGKKGVEQMRNEGWETRENKERRTPRLRDLKNRPRNGKTAGGGGGEGLSLKRNVQDSLRVLV